MSQAGIGSPADPNSVIGFLAESAKIGAKVTLVIPTGRFISAIVNQSPDELSAARSIVKSFVETVLRSPFGSVVESFEIGNEYYAMGAFSDAAVSTNRSASSIYGQVASNVSKWVQQVVVSVAPVPQPDIFVQAGRSNANNLEIIGSFDREGLASVDGVVIHNYRWTPWESQDITTDKFMQIYAWEAATNRELKTVVSEWNVASPSGVVGLPAAAGLLDMLNLQERLGADIAHVWPLFQKTTNTLGIEGGFGSDGMPRLSIGGEVFRQAARLLPGLSPYEMNSEVDLDGDGNADVLIHAYGNSTSTLVVFVSSLQATQTNLSLDLSAFGALTRQYSHMWAQILGVRAGASPVDHKATPQILSYMANEVEGVVVGDGVFEIELDPFEVGILDFSRGSAGVEMHGHDQTDTPDTLSGSAGNDSIFGELGGDQLFGLVGNDALNGGAGDDTLDGGGGNDSLDGGDGKDNLAGGDGSDFLMGYSGDDVADGGTGNDTVVGHSGNDKLDGGSGTDVLWADDGNDTLDGGADGDWLHGQAGNDSLDGGLGNDWVLGYAGDDAAFGSTGDDTVVGHDGNDWLFGGDGRDVIWGDEGGDRLFGGTGLDFLFGCAGNDSLQGGSDGDQLFGGDGHDEVAGGEGNDLVVGQAGDDTVRGDGGNDVVVGHVGDDWLFGDSGDDILWGDEGSDVLEGGIGHDWLFGQDGDDSVIGGDGIDHIYGGQASDTLSGGDSDDSISGDGGADSVFGGAGNDRVEGGEGSDSIWGDVGNDTVEGGVDNDALSGGEGGDILNGGSGDDVLFGDEGLDTIAGGDGQDILFGGFGADVLYGGAGADCFVFNYKAEFGTSSSFESIEDFQAGVDIVDLSALDIRIVGTGGFSGSGNEASLEAVQGGAIVWFDFDGNLIADTGLKIGSATSLSLGDFVT